MEAALTGLALIVLGLLIRNELRWRKLTTADPLAFELLEAAPDAMFVVNADGRIELINRQAELLLGYDRRELVGECVDVLLLEDKRAAHAADRARYMAAPRPRPMGEPPGVDIYIRHRDGHPILCEISLGPTDDEQLVIAAVRPKVRR